MLPLLRQPSRWLLMLVPALALAAPPARAASAGSSVDPCDASRYIVAGVGRDSCRLAVAAPRAGRDRRAGLCARLELTPRHRPVGRHGPGLAGSPRLLGERALRGRRRPRRPRAAPLLPRRTRLRRRRRPLQ